MTRAERIHWYGGLLVVALMVLCAAFCTAQPVYGQPARCTPVLAKNPRVQWTGQGGEYHIERLVNGHWRPVEAQINGTVAVPDVRAVAGVSVVLRVAACNEHGCSYSEPVVLCWPGRCDS